MSLKNASLETRARLLGYGGLVPFVAGAIGIWLAAPDQEPFVTRALIGYGAVILSFLGAVHWGVAISRDGEGWPGQLTLSVVPALVAWGALMLPALLGCGLLIAAFAGHYLADRSAADRDILPRWYARLRVYLSVGVLACLGAAAIALV